MLIRPDFASSVGHETGVDAALPEDDSDSEDGYSEVDEKEGVASSTGPGRDRYTGAATATSATAASDGATVAGTSFLSRMFGSKPTPATAPASTATTPVPDRGGDAGEGKAKKDGTRPATATTTTTVGEASQASSTMAGQVAVPLSLSVSETAWRAEKVQLQSRIAQLEQRGRELEDRILQLSRPASQG